MRILKSIALSFITAAAIFGFSSCNSTDAPAVTLYHVDLDGETTLTFNGDNYWTGCYDVTEGACKIDGFSFSHKAWADEWDGQVYPAWRGFCPSKVNDTADHADDWVNHQWACVPQNPYNMVYIVGNSESVVSDNPLENDKCAVSMASGEFFNPQYVFVTNSTYAYYAAKNGTAFNSPFTVGDNFVLNVVGVRNGVMTAHLKFGLMAGGEFLTEWAPISLEPLGTVDKVLFYIDSTQKNSYGLTVPAYFCMTSFVFSLPITAAQ